MTAVPGFLIIYMVFFFQFCDLGVLVTIHMRSYPNFATGQTGKK